MADALSSLTQYNFSFNNPIRFNDPLGDCPPGTDCNGDAEQRKEQDQAKMQGQSSDFFARNSGRQSGGGGGIQKYLPGGAPTKKEDPKQEEKKGDGVDQQCSECPNPEDSYEFQKFNGSTFLAGNWVADNKKEGDYQTINGKGYRDEFGRWIPIYNPEGVATKYTGDYIQSFLLGWGITGILTKSYRVSGAATVVGFFVGIGQTGINDWRDHMERYYSPSERQNLRKQAEELIKKYNLKDE